jgi:phage terminase large subunit GpA-like protein
MAVMILKITQKTVDFFRKILKIVTPPPNMTVSEWADKFRRLAGYAIEPGRWKTNRAPYQRRIMDCFTLPGVKRVIAMCAVQVGKSEILNNVLGRFIHLDPCPTLLVMPTDQDGADYSKESLAPNIEATPVLRERIADPKSRDSSNTIQRKIFPGGFLAIVGSNSPKNLNRRTIRLLLVDELDDMEESSGTQGDILALAIKRTSNVWNAVIGIFSSPKGEKSRIADEYYLGSQEEWRHECPNCGEMHWVTFWDMRYEYEVFTVEDKQSYKINLIFWRCPDCCHEFTEQQMRETRQDYVALNPEITHIRSFRINSFASPWVPWDTIIMEYLEAGEDQEKLKVFVNTRLAEIYQPKGDIKDERVLMQRRERYDADLPDGILLLTAAVDTQDNRLEYEICGWGEDEECWGIKKGIILGVPDKLETWEELDQQLDRLYYFADGTGLKIARTFIDSGGHYTKEVYKYCLKNGRKQRIAIKGHRLIGVPIIYKMGKADGYQIPLVLLGVSEGKQYVMQRLMEKTQPGPQYFHFPDDDQRGYDQLYFRGLIAEKKMPKIVKGKKVMTWQNISQDGRNEPLDLRVYNLACLYSINPNWSVYKQLINNTKTEEKAEKKEKKQSEKRYGCIKKSSV